jgi:hypothetical protein
MNWYSVLPLIKEAAARPPVYTECRISDIRLAREKLFTDPQEAEKILNSVVKDLEAQKNDSFVSPLKEALAVKRDSPARAAAILDKTVLAIEAERTLFERERESEKKPWMKKKKK